MYRVALVCEGPTDRVILEAVLDRYFDDYEPLPVQPPISEMGGDAGPFGAGWKGVRAWCTSEVASQGGLDRVAVLENADILVIQIDADVAAEDEIGIEQPCPPPGDTVDAVQTLLKTWLGTEDLPARVVLCVPSKASETWAFVALFPDHPEVVPCDSLRSDTNCVECRTDIKRLLRRETRNFRTRLVVSQGGVLKNKPTGYRAVQDRIAEGWDAVLRLCSEARRFDNELQAATS